MEPYACLSVRDSPTKLPTLFSSAIFTAIETGVIRVNKVTMSNKGADTYQDRPQT